MSQQHLTINGWCLLAHPLLLEQIENLIEQVKILKKKHPHHYQQKNAYKRLAAIRKLIFEVIPADPSKEEYRLGKTLGPSYKHWFRAKFFQQYRLFFRFDSELKIIIFAWVNDEKNKRAHESKTDAYQIFCKMLNKGNPPDDWETLQLQTKALDMLNS